MGKLHLLIPILIITFPLVFAGEGDVYGPVTREDILRARPEWKTRLSEYSPDWEAVEFLSTLEAPVHIEVFLGTWSSECAEHVGELFKILDMTENPQISVTYTTLPRDRAERSQYLEGREVSLLPTFIILVSGMEYGRIVEHPDHTLEEDIAALLRSGEGVPLDYDFFMSNYHADMDVDCTECHLH